MIKIIKDGVSAWVETKSKAQPYLKAGWKLSGEVKAKEVELVEPTKKELQSQLEAKGIAYSPRDNKAALQAKLEGKEPTDNFDDGLLKG